MGFRLRTVPLPQACNESGIGRSRAQLKPVRSMRQSMRRESAKPRQRGNEESRTQQVFQSDTSLTFAFSRPISLHSDGD
jgi:hypothetical protein